MEQTDIKKVLKTLKHKLKIKTDKELSGIFGVKPNTVSSWKTRNTIDYERLIAICRNHNLDLNELFYPLERGHRYNTGRKYAAIGYQYRYVTKKH